MKINLDRAKDTEAVFIIEATSSELEKVKNKVLTKLAPSVKLSGFRDGKAPLAMVEKSVNQETLQQEVVNEAINVMYVTAIKEERIRPVAQPKVEVTKFVPFATLEVKINVPVVGEIVLPNYKKIASKREPVKVADKQVNGVLTNLQTRSAEKKEVKRPVKDEDEVLIDFKGFDSKGEPVNGADGNDYPLVIGSGTFIPGFEKNVKGMKIDEKKKFDLKFPSDYGAKALQNKKVTFDVTLKKVTELKKPTIDDKFASTVGPFKNLQQLKDDIKKQLEAEETQKVERDYESAIVTELVEKTKVAIPDVLIEEQKEMVLQELRQNVVQRGMTYDEFIASSGMSDEEYRKKEITPEANRRVKAGLMLSEIADIEGIDVSKTELSTRINALKEQYKDQKMQEELEKPENQREINARLRTEKVIAFLKIS